MGRAHRAHGRPRARDEAASPRVTLHTWEIGPEETTTLDGVIRLTDPGRTLRDTLLSVDRETAVCLMDSALNQALISEEELTPLVLANRGRKGSVRTRRWRPLADGRAESPLETRVRLACTDAGFPPTDLQHRFLDGTGRTIAVADMCWSSVMVPASLLAGRSVRLMVTGRGVLASPCLF